MLPKVLGSADSSGASAPDGQHLGAQLGEGAGGDRGPGPGQQGERPGQVVDADQPRCRRLTNREEVAQVAAAVAGADGARAVRVERSVLEAVAGRLDVELAGAGERRAVAAE